MNPFQSTYRDEFQLLIVVLLGVLAWYRGGGPERSATAIMFAMLVTDRVYHAMTGNSGSLLSTDAWHFSLDVAILVAFVVVGLRANRFYPLLLAGFQLVAVCAHIVRGFAEAISPIAYYVMYVAPSYFQIIVIGIGIWAHRRRFERFGNYRDWRVAAAAG